MRTCRTLVLTVIVLICWTNMLAGSVYVPNVNGGQQLVTPYDPRYFNQNPYVPNNSYEYHTSSEVNNVAVPVRGIMNGLDFNFIRPVSRQGFSYDFHKLPFNPGFV